MHASPFLRAIAAHFRRVARVSGALVVCAGLLAAAAAIAEPKVIGKTEPGVRVVRGGKDAPPAAGAPDAVLESGPATQSGAPALSPRGRAAYDALDRVAELRTPAAGADREATALAKKIVTAYGGPRALQDWLEGGERRGKLAIYQPTSVQGQFRTRQKGESLRLDVHTGAFDASMVVRPDGGWQNMLGLVSDVADEQRDEMAIARAHDESLLLDAATGRVPASRLTTSEGEALVVWGPRGDPTVFLVEPASGRVAASAFRDRSVLRGTKVSHVYEFDDWRELAPGTADARGPTGAVIPYVVSHSMDGLPIERYELTQVDLLAAVDDTVFARPGETKLTLGQARRVTLPLERHGGHHFAWVRLGDSAPRLFLVDTGAGLTAVSQELADTLGLPLGDAAGMLSAGGGFGARSSTIPSLSLGTIERRDVTCVVIDFSELRSSLAPNLEGILGASALNRLAVTFDFEHDALVLTEGGEATSAGTSGVRVRFQALGGQISVPGRLEGGAEFPFILDTGAPITFVPDEAVQGIHDAPRVPGVEYYGVDGRPLEGEAIRLRSLSIGSLRVDRPIVVTTGSGGAEDPTGLTISSGTRGVLGSNVLRRFKLTLDYPRGEVVFVPIAGAKEDDGGLVGPGVVVDGSRGSYFVRAVVAGSAAAREGVAPGDRILAIDGRLADYLNDPPGGAQLLGVRGSKAELKLRSKDGRERTLRLVREPLL
jgi:clan AA aspartic protease (TIGR02281 family)